MNKMDLLGKLWDGSNIIVLLRIFFIALFVPLQASANSDYADPISPEHAPKIVNSASVPFYRIFGKIKEIDYEIAQKRAELDCFPKLHHTLQPDAYGYHSDRLSVSSVLPERPRWTIDLETKTVAGDMDLVLVPSLDRRNAEPKGYGFPRRFRIVNSDPRYPEKILVDWTTEDFPDPKLRPVYFHLPEAVGINVRLEVFSGQVENELEYFSLARVYCIRRSEVQFISKIEASSSLEVAPYWSAEYLAEARSTLGMPVKKTSFVGKDFVLPLTPEQSKKELFVDIDFGENYKHGWINLFPTQSGDGVKVPGFGFPKGLRVEIMGEGTNGQIGKVSRLENSTDLNNPADNLLSLPWKGFSGRWLRLVFTDFPIYQNQSYFSIGEIEVVRRGERQNVIKPPSILIDGEVLDVDTSPMVDGFATGGEILLLEDWFRVLAAAKPLEADLERLLLEARSFRIHRDSLKNSILVGFILSVMAASFFLVYSEITKRVEDKRQIARDLHDEVGSNLGSISLTAERLQRYVTDPTAKEDLLDLTLLSREASASLRDVIWVIDKSSIRLPELMEQLMERAQRVLRGVKVITDVSDNCPDYLVSLAFKRHLVMFFKEAVHNCARHAKASEVMISVNFSADTLTLELRDNGCGFDQKKKQNGWGLDSMKKRAHELGGELYLQSIPGKGTELKLAIPKRVLVRKFTQTYRTSN